MEVLYFKYTHRELMRARLSTRPAAGLRYLSSVNPLHGASLSFLSRQSRVTLEPMASACEVSQLSSCVDAQAALRLNVGALFAILVASAIGVALPLVIKGFTEGKLFFAGRCFSSGIILATGFVHILPEAFDSLRSPCLPEMPWGKFPFGGFVAMVAAILTLCLDTLGMAYYRRRATRRQAKTDEPDQSSNVAVTVVPVLQSPSADVVPHAGHSHGHSHLNDDDGLDMTVQARNKVIAQVLELGIITHSVVIGIGMGALKSPCEIRPLIAALCFHQLFEGISLGGCICLGDFTKLTSAIMAFMFSVTTPAGLAIGIGIASVYNENDPKSLVIQGMFNAVSAGILVYMALVDLIATDFLSKDFIDSLPKQAVGYVSLSLGAIAMSVIGLWA